MTFFVNSVMKPFSKDIRFSLTDGLNQDINESL